MKKIILSVLTLFSLTALPKEIVIGDKLFVATMNDIYTNLEEEYQNVTVTFEGNLIRENIDDPDYDDTLFPFVYRIGPGCCYDIYAGMYLNYDGNVPEDDTWVKVSGKPYYLEHNGYTDIFLKVEKLEVMEKRGNIIVKD